MSFGHVSVHDLLGGLRDGGRVRRRQIAGEIALRVVIGHGVLKLSVQEIRYGDWMLSVLVLGQSRPSGKVWCVIIASVTRTEDKMLARKAWELLATLEDVPLSPLSDVC